MPMTEDERRELVAYIENRMCKEYRSGESCMDGPAGSRAVRRSPHPACVKAAQMIEIVRRV